VEPLVAGVRIVHALYVAFVVTAPALRWTGISLASRRLTAPALGRLHLACLGFATLQLACGWPCPLTWLEEQLAGTGPGTFVVPAAWTGAAAVPAWAWLALALMWAASLLTERAILQYRMRMEAA
jgi:hypothetical protein